MDLIPTPAVHDEANALLDQFVATGTIRLTKEQAELVMATPLCIEKTPFKLVASTASFLLKVKAIRILYPTNYSYRLHVLGISRSRQPVEQVGYQAYRVGNQMTTSLSIAFNL